MNKNRLLISAVGLVILWPGVLWGRAPADAAAKPLQATSRPADATDEIATTSVFIGPGGKRTEIRVQGAGHVRVITLRETVTSSDDATPRPRTITLRENIQGIQLTVSEPDRDGRVQVREFKAKIATQLKQENPEAYALYERLSNMAAVQGRAATVVARSGHLPSSLGPAPALWAMNPDREQPLAIRFGVLVMDADPATKAQLGSGVVVMDLLTNSRAMRLGLQPYDLVQKVNDARIESVQAFEKAIGGKPPVVIEVIRAGKALKLEEK